jgi:hypothetical protein
LRLAIREKWQTLPGTGFSAAGRREAFHRLGVQDVTEFDSYAYWEKIKKEKWPGVFFPKAGHILLAVLHGIFMAVRSN